MYPTVRRIAVLDFDVHHGNGTEDILKDDTETMFLSVQRHGGNFFPCLSGATCFDGNVCNVGLPEGYDSEAFRHAMMRTMLPRLHGFVPDLILISAGFDGHSSDPIGGAKLEEDDFAWATARIMQVAEMHCQGRVVSVLEGGYNARSPEGGLAACVSSHVKMLCGMLKLPPEDQPDADDADSALGDLMQVEEEEEEPVVEEKPQVPATPTKPGLQVAPLAPKSGPPGSPKRSPTTPQPGILSPLASRAKPRTIPLSDIAEGQEEGAEGAECGEAGEAGEKALASLEQLDAQDEGEVPQGQEDAGGSEGGNEHGEGQKDAEGEEKPSANVEEGAPMDEDRDSEDQVPTTSL